jgi:hypothetical protein
MRMAFKYKNAGQRKKLTKIWALAQNSAAAEQRVLRAIGPWAGSGTSRTAGGACFRSK